LSLRALHHLPENLEEAEKAWQENKDWLMKLEGSGEFVVCLLVQSPLIFM